MRAGRPGHGDAAMPIALCAHGDVRPWACVGVGDPGHYACWRIGGGQRVALCGAMRAGVWVGRRVRRGAAQAPTGADAGVCPWVGAWAWVAMGQGDPGQ